MLKNISNLGKTLNKAEQQAISGGKRGLTGPIVCNSPYFKSDSSEVCNAGYHDHPTMGHCICCKN